MTELKSKRIVFSSEVVVEGPNKFIFFTDPDRNPLYIIEEKQDKCIKFILIFKSSFSCNTIYINT